MQTAVADLSHNEIISRRIAVEPVWTRSAYEIFYATCKQGLSIVDIIKFMPSAQIPHFKLKD